MRAARIVLVGLLVAVVAVGAFPAILELRSMGTKKFEPEQMDFALLAGSTFALSIGAQVVPWRAAPYLTLLATLATAALLFGVLAMFSIGLAFVPAGLVLLLLLYRALRRVPDNIATRGGFGGAAVGFALPLLYIALAVPATVECFPNGGGTSSRRWHPSSQFSSSGRVGVDGVQPGEIIESDSTVAYRCENGRLVEFTRTPR